MNNQIKNIVFDLDGVLIDSIEVMKIAWASSCNLVEINIPFKEYKKNIGLPFIHILEELNIDKLLFKKIQDEYDKASILNQNLIKPYKFTLDTLSYLKDKNINLHIVTSKEKNRTNKILEDFFPNNMFDITITPDDLEIGEGKPNPKSIKIIIQKQKISANKILYIGDTLVDYECSRQAGCNFLFAKWGYGENSKEVSSISDINELKDII